jgi:hypothetical protein
VKEIEMCGARSQHRSEKEWKEMGRNPEEKRPLGRHRSRWEGIIKMDLKRYGIAWCGLN